MGPSIILDKNALQGLSFLEVQALHRFYLVYIPPVLMKEVIGDMAKLTERGTPEQEVTVLARKLLPGTIVVNSEVNWMVRGECAGYPVHPDMRPHLNAVPKETTGGAFGFHIPETPEAIALGRWRNNEFRDGDRLTGELWRSATTNPQRIADLRSFWNGYPPFSGRIGNLEEALIKADRLLQEPQLQAFWLKFMVQEFALPAKNVSETFAQWRAAGRPPIASFAPYGIYCCRVRLLFILAVLNDLVGGTTNEIDLEYLYYLPFTRVFVSSDRFHQRFVPLLLREGQRYWKGDDLKSDLRTIIDHMRVTHGTEGLPPTVDRPPSIEGSITHEIWSSLNRHPRAVPTDEKYEGYHVRTMDAILNGTWAPPITRPNGEPDYFVTTASYGPEDLCLCKSGLFVKECPCKAAQALRSLLNQGPISPPAR